MKNNDKHDVRETQREKETQQNQQIKRGPQNTTKTLQKTGTMTCGAESEQVSFKCFCECRVDVFVHKLMKNHIWLCKNLDFFHREALRR